mgnify:CR=1 FL=1
MKKLLLLLSLTLFLSQGGYSFSPSCPRLDLLPLPPYPPILTPPNFLDLTEDELNEFMKLEKENLLLQKEWEEIAEKLTQLKETVEESTPGGYLIRELLGFFKDRMLSRELTSKRSKKSFDVWLVSISGDFREEVSNIREKTEDGCPWSAPRRALKGDLILMYRTSPDSRIQDIFVLAELAKFHPEGWGEGPTWMAPYRRVAKLEKPITLDNFKQRKNKKLKKLEYLLRGRQKISKYWPDLYEFILKQNSGRFALGSP